MRALWLLPIMVSAGCVQVSAPERPIEINLNVNVKQEVLVRLQRDAQQLIEENPELFPK
ncbi:YnbE family lipoprotein [Sphingomonas sp. ID1715]|uniref:YnbE family lipoprotein n=1 Tax=Sphingomonas sp. ID1715 TaxID=1656898 RepID=UPI0014895AB3|nr:YnbE family lipoprotein [Sphingomonas sp. ID1715]NNM75475.1 YnbE family lipoprotein [Sphingomonas sp. ID1715]